MSPKSIVISAPNNTTFNRPIFSKTSGNGGTGAYGEISDGQLNLFGLATGWIPHKATLTLTPELLKTIRQYNRGVSIYMRGGAACAMNYFMVNGVRYDIARTGDSSFCGSINPEWLWSVTNNCTVPIDLVSPVGSCTNPGSGILFATSSTSVPDFKQSGDKFNMTIYKQSILSQKTSTYSVYGTSKGACGVNVFWV